MLILATASARAIPYSGTITQTITETNDPLYYVGQTFIGSFQYTAPTPDGTFSNGGGSSDHGNLLVYLYGAFSPFNGSDPRGMLFLGGGSSHSLLTVTSGVVTSYIGVAETGAGGNWYLLSNNFLWYTLQVGRWETLPDGSTVFIDSPTTRGTLTFSAPVEVPDFGATVLMLGVAMLGAFGINSVIRRRNV